MQYSTMALGPAAAFCHPSLLIEHFGVDVAEVSERMTSNIHSQHFVFADISKLRVCYRGKVIFLCFQKSTAASVTVRRRVILPVPDY